MEYRAATFIKHMITTAKLAAVPPKKTQSFQAEAAGVIRFACNNEIRRVADRRVGETSRTTLGVGILASLSHTGKLDSRAYNGKQKLNLTSAFIPIRANERLSEASLSGSRDVFCQRSHKAVIVYVSLVYNRDTDCSSAYTLYRFTNRSSN